MLIAGVDIKLWMTFFFIIHVRYSFRSYEYTCSEGPVNAETLGKKTTSDSAHTEEHYPQTSLDGFISK